MSSEIKSKKRKALMPNDEVAKSKKIKSTSSDAVPKKRKAITESDSIMIKKSKALKLTNAETSSITATKKTTATTEESAKNSKNAANGRLKPSQNAATTRKQAKFLKGGTEKKDKQRNRQGIVPVESLSFSDAKIEDAVSILDEGEVDDQTEALIKGFESEDDDEKVFEDKGYEAGQKIPKLDKETKKQTKAAKDASTSDKPGVIYVGRIPHGFYEQEMRQYFSQFGDISNLRLSRNRKTGSSKHYAFIEFESAEVAEIVSKTMDNYLLFGHILKCKMVAPEQVHQNLWEGANKRFKKVPWNKMESRKLKQGMTEEAWNKRIEKEEVRRAKKKEALKSMGYEFESPKVKSAKEVTKEKEQSLIATDYEQHTEEIGTIKEPHLGGGQTSGMETAEPGKSKKNQKLKKLGTGNAMEGVSEPISNLQYPPALEENFSEQESSDMKNKKATGDLDVSLDNTEPQSGKNVDVMENEKVAKGKKSRKAKAL